ncbi:MAG: PGPGW domain-containing protein [Planctomycetaceae bacterium]|nr:PGPGW domain-containing protein [Planctomycetaceae bacterium]
MSIQNNLSPEFWTIIAILSGLTLLASAVITPWLLSMIPQDYFLTHEEYLGKWKTTRPLLRGTVLLIRNLIGLALCLLGLIMLVTPGQGMVMILLGLACSTFPGKRTLELKILNQRGVLSSVNWLRKKMNRQPLLLPEPANENRTQSRES